MDEEPTALEIPSVSEVGTTDYVETEDTKLIELKPVSYDVEGIANDGTDVFDKIDNHNVDLDHGDEKITSKDDSVDRHSDQIDLRESSDKKESIPKVNGVLKFSGKPSDADKKSSEISPNTTPGKSRYGRIRKPKLSTDFISVDRKSFAVLSNTSSYEHVYAEETPRKAVIKSKPRKSSAKVENLESPKQDQPPKSLTKSSIDNSNIAQSTPVDEKDTPKPAALSSDTPKSVKSTSGAPKRVKSISSTPKIIKSTSNAPKSTRTKTPKISKPPKDDSVESAVSPLTSKDTIKTYSRKGETTTAVSATEENQIEKVDEEKLSRINHVELSWKVGDVAWAKIGCYSYWPSIVTLEYGSSIYVKSVGNRRLAVHVQFFGDRGRRSWVLTTSLIKYQSKEQFFELKKQFKKDKIRLKYFLIKPTCQDLWEKAVNEADTVLKLPHEERIPYYQSLYPISEKSLVAETSSFKSKRPVVRKKKNPEERRGRKRKILSDPSATSVSKKPRHAASESDSPGAVAEKLPSTETTIVKKRQPIDEHIKKRRAFMRRMNKILRQSNNNDYPTKKKPKNGLKQHGKNAKFNKLLDKENERKKQQKLTENSAAGSSSSPDSDQKKKDMSVYDFESDEETDVFIGTYNSRFTPQILAKIEQEKTTEKDETKKLSFTENDSECDVQADKIENEDGNLSSNEIKARRLFSNSRKRFKDTDHTRPKGTASKFSKLFERRKATKGVRGKKNIISARRRNITRTKGAKKILQRGPRRKAPTHEATPIPDIKHPEDKHEIGDIDIFREKMMEKIDAEHPEFTDEQIDEHLEKLWSELDDTEKSKYKLEYEFASDDGEGDVGVVDDDVKSSGNENDDDAAKLDEKRSPSPSSSTVPSSSKPKKLSSIFTGYKAEKVCQICEKPGDTVRCRGPCAGTFHVECVQKLIAAKDTCSPVNTPPRRGRRKKVSMKPVAETAATKESIKMDIEPDTVVEKKTEESATGKRSKKSTVSDNDDETKGDEFVKPAPRRSRRMEDRVKNITDREDHDIKEVESETDVSIEENIKTDDEPLPESASVTDESCTEHIASKAELAQEKKDNVVDSVKSQTDTNVNEGAIEKLNAEVGSTSDKLAENVSKNEKTNINDESAESQNEKILTSDKENSAEKSSKPENDTEASKEETSTVSVVTDSANSSISKIDKSNGGIDFMCNLCADGIVYPCFACGKNEQEKTGDTKRFPCHLSSCGRVFHRECLKAWPQATWITNNAKPRNGSSSTAPKETLLCPQHYCHTCISDNPAALKSRQGQAKLVRCIKCPTTYHQNVHCIPAGSELLTMSQIICPRHYVPPKMKSTHINASWCFICCIGGSLICCEECPTSFHTECLQLSPEEYEGRYICDDCQTGRYLLYGEIVWVKLGHYRWWPANILYPQEVPENIAHMPHNRGEFAVRFFGSHDYNWVNRGRAFVYQEGDSGKKNPNRTVVDLTFEKALKEAEEAYQKLKIDKALREEEAKLGLKPPRYIRIKSNKPIGNVRIVELNTSNIPECRCDPNSERPCAPESDCLNRILLVECNPRVCSAGERCLNQAFEKRVYPPLVPYRTDKRGWGLKTLVDIKKGDFIIEYVGEMIDEEEYKRRVSHMYKNQEENYYFLTIDNNRMLDAGPKGNVSRFMNHSCDPNCETQKWTVNGDTRVGLFALRDIPVNAELVFNYNLATLGNEKKPCLCGSEKCSGFIGVKAVKNGNNGNNGGNSNGDDDTRRKSNDDNRKRSLEDEKNGGNGAKSSATGKKVGRKAKRKRKTVLGKRAALTSTTSSPSNSLPIKKRKISTKVSTKSNTVETEKSISNDLSPPNTDDVKADTTSVAKSSADGTVSNDAESVSALKCEIQSAANSGEDHAVADSSSKDEQNIPNEEDKKTALEDFSNDKTMTPEDIEALAETTVAVEVPNVKVTVASTNKKQRKPIVKLRGRKKGTEVKFQRPKKKGPGSGRGRGKKKVGTLRKRNDKLIQKRAKKVMLNKNRKMAAVAAAKTAAPTIKVKSIENRVVGKRGRKPHLTEEDREQALYKSLKKRLHKKLRVMTGISKLEEDCFMCKEKGELIFCDNKKCPKGYHISCVMKLFKLPKGRWLCPWHYCTACNSKCKVAKCSRCINSFCRLHIDDNIYISCEEALICKDHKSEYLADKLQVLSNSNTDMMLNTSTDNDSLNLNESSNQIINADSLLIPLRAPKPKHRMLPKPRKPIIHTTHMLPPFIKIKEEALSDVEMDPDSEPEHKPTPVIIGESRNVARRSKKLVKKIPPFVENHAANSIDNMTIDEFIEIHHVEAIEVSGNEMSNDEAKSIDSSAEEYEEDENDYGAREEKQLANKPADSFVNSAEESDDDYLDVEMEVIQDDSS